MNLLPYHRQDKRNVYSINFYAELDRFISAWYQDNHASDPLMDQKKPLSIDHLPEPFYGDMENCSIVSWKDSGFGNGRDAVCLKVKNGSWTFSDVRGTSGL